MYSVEVAKKCSNTSAPSTTRRLLAFIVLGLSIGLSRPALNAAQSVTLAWDPSPDASVIGYSVHYGTFSRNYSDVVDAHNSTMATVNGLEAGKTYFFAVTAYNQQRIESEPSGEISYTVPPILPGLLRILRSAALNSLPRLQFLVSPAHQYEVQASEDLKSWTTIHTGVSVSTNWLEFTDPKAALLPKRFYRLALPDKPLIPGVISILPRALPSVPGRLELSVLAGQRYQIQASQDLKSWTTIYQGISASSEPIDFTDLQSGSLQKRFYRLAFD